MKILNIDGFKEFAGFSRKKANCIRIWFRKNGEGELMSMTVSEDHRMILVDSGIDEIEENRGTLEESEIPSETIEKKGLEGLEKWVEAKDLKEGEWIEGLDGNCRVEKLESVGERMVYTPVEVDGEQYVSGKGNVVGHNCSFLGSSSTLIDGEWLDKMLARDPLEWKYGYDMAVYERPKEGFHYVMGVDTAMGNGGDYSVVQVLKIVGKERFEQVAVYRRNTIQADDFAEIVHDVSEWYFGAQYIVENNDVGRSVAEKLYYDLGSGGMISTDSRGALGTRADRGTKLEACKTLKKMIEKEMLLVIDGNTIDELSRFEEVTPNVFKAQKGKHDDCVSALYWACYCLLQPEVGVEGMDEGFIPGGSESSRMALDDGPLPMAIEGAVLGPGCGLSNDFWAGLN